MPSKLDRSLRSPRIWTRRRPRRARSVGVGSSRSSRWPISSSRRHRTRGRRLLLAGRRCADPAPLCGRRAGPVRARRLARPGPRGVDRRGRAPESGSPSSLIGLRRRVPPARRRTRRGSHEELGVDDGRRIRVDARGASSPQYDIIVTFTGTRRVAPSGSSPRCGRRRGRGRPGCRAGSRSRSRSCGSGPGSRLDEHRGREPAVSAARRSAASSAGSWRTR